jgi:hypothetical protein
MYDGESRDTLEIFLLSSLRNFVVTLWETDQQEL